MTPWIVAGAAAAAAAVAVALLVAARRHAATLQARHEGARRSLERLQHAFGRFAPGDVIEDIIERGVEVKGEKKDVTILFADVQGFTAMSETTDAEVLVRILNGYFARMSRAISAHNGHVAKLIGDGIMALFGALEPNPWQHDDAVRAALAMRAALGAYNHELAAQGLPRLAIGVGIHRGEVVAGVVGSPELMEFTCLGDHVNLAARVESLTRQHGVDILITPAVRQGLDPRFSLRELPPARVKGKSEPVVTYAVQDGPG